jgi:hypothetical protein
VVRLKNSGADIFVSWTTPKAAALALQKKSENSAGTGIFFKQHGDVG